MPKKKQKIYAGYFRVSTAGQGIRGAGLAAQRKAVLSHINGKAKLIKEFKEVESGTKDRPRLRKAIAFCKETGACLVASKMDRLARSVWLFEAIKREGIDFEIVGLPKNPLVLQILASVAEWESRAISERTKAALAIKKAQGKKLGYNRRATRAGHKRYWRQKKRELAARPKPREVKQPSKMERADKPIIPIIRLLRAQGASYEAIAAELKKSGLETRRGGQWTKQQAHKVAARNGLA